MASDANGCPIYLIDRDGVFVAKLDKTDGRGGCCIELTVIVRAILKTDTINSVLAQMTAEYVDHYLVAWFLIKGEGTHKERQDKVAPEFLEMFSILLQFPALCVNYRLRHLSVIGATRRIIWEKHFRLFAQRISLNGGLSTKLTRFRCSLAS